VLLFANLITTMSLKLLLCVTEKAKLDNDADTKAEMSSSSSSSSNGKKKDEEVDEEDEEEDEPRLKRYRSVITQPMKDRMSRALSQRMFLVGRYTHIVLFYSSYLPALPAVTTAVSI
jgi:hypothetical protein